MIIPDRVPVKNRRLASCPGEHDAYPSSPGVFRSGGGLNDWGRLGWHDADLNLPGGHLSVFLLADEINLGRPDVGMAGELPHLMHRGPVADGVVDRRLA